MATSAKTSEAIGTGLDHRTVESELEWETTAVYEQNDKKDKKRYANNKCWRPKDEEAFTSMICEGLSKNREVKGDEWMHMEAEDKCKVIENLLLDTVEIQGEIEKRAPRVND